MQNYFGELKPHNSKYCSNFVLFLACSWYSPPLISQFCLVREIKGTQTLRVLQYAMLSMLNTLRRQTRQLEATMTMALEIPDTALQPVAASFSFSSCGVIFGTTTVPDDLIDDRLLYCRRYLQNSLWCLLRLAAYPVTYGHGSLHRKDFLLLLCCAKMWTSRLAFRAAR